MELYRIDVGLKALLTFRSANLNVKPSERKQAAVRLLFNLVGDEIRVPGRSLKVANVQKRSRIE